MKIFGTDSGKLSKWLTLVFIGASVICVLALLISGLPGAIRNGDEWPTVRIVPGKDLSFDVSQDFPVSGIENVSIDTSFESVELTGISGDAFQVRYLGAARNADDWTEVFTMEVKENTLILDSHWGKAAPIGGNVSLEVGIPGGFDGSLEFSGASGSLSAQNLSIGIFEARLVSGSLKAVNVEADSVSLRTSSGALEAEHIKAGTVDLHIVSGRMSISNLEATSIAGKSSSGRSTLQDISGSLDFSGVSGGVVVSFVSPGKDIDIDVSSGSINLSLPAGTGFELDAQSSSGRITSDFPVTVTSTSNRNSLKGRAGSGDGRIVKLRSASGGITINEG